MFSIRKVSPLVLNCWRYIWLAGAIILWSLISIRGFIHKLVMSAIKGLLSRSKVLQGSMSIYSAIKSSTTFDLAENSWGHDWSWKSRAHGHDKETMNHTTKGLTSNLPLLGTLRQMCELYISQTACGLVWHCWSYSSTRNIVKRFLQISTGIRRMMPLIGQRGFQSG